MKNKKDHYYEMTYSQKDFSISFKPFGIPVLSYYYHNRFGWIRIFGRGLKFKDYTLWDMTFSERNGLSKSLKIGKWMIGYLHYNKP